MRILAFVFLFIYGNVVAQNNSIEFNTINNQFQKLYKKSSNYTIYKVIKKEGFLKLQKNVTDTISNLKTVIITKQKRNDLQSQTIGSLDKEIETLNNKLRASISKENNISFLGIPMKKSSYSILVWSLNTILLTSLLFFIYKFLNSNILTKKAKQNLSEKEEELEVFRKKSLEREQKLRRQLQDEINKQRGV